MKKLHYWIGVIALSSLASINVGAQPDNFYRFTGNYDHGTGREVIHSVPSSLPQGYVVTGTAHIPLPNNTPAVFVTHYDMTGLPVWSKIYPITTTVAGPSTVADGISIAGFPGGYGVLAYTDFTTPAQSVLIITNVMGVPTASAPLGQLRAASVIFDPVTGLFVVLSQAPTNGGDFQLIRVNPAGGIIGINTYDSGPGFNDVPSRLMKDPATGGYVLVGTSITAADNNVFVVHTNNVGALLCSETIGSTAVKEMGVDVTPGINATTGAATDIVLCNSFNGINTPFVLELSTLACPGVMSITMLNPPKPDNIPNAIASEPPAFNYIITGQQNDVNTNGFVATLNQKLNPMLYIRYGQPTLPGNEDLKDVYYDGAAATPQLVFTGEHQLLGSWPGMPTPAGEFFDWLPMTNAAGVGMCPEVNPLNTSPISFPAITYTLSGSFFSPSPVNVFNFSIGKVLLDECTHPFRLGGTQESGSLASVYPNPASSEINVTYTASGTNDVTLELTNMLGEVVLRQSLSADNDKAVIDVSAIVPGMYFYRITDGENELANEKIIISH